MSMSLETRLVEDADVSRYAALYAREAVPDAGTTSAAYFRWKFLDNPQGRAWALHLVEGDELGGMFVLVPRRYRLGQSTWTCAYAVNLLVDASRRGIANLHVLLRGLRAPPGFDFLMSTPNALAIPIWDRFLKYPTARELDVFVAPLRPAALLAHSGRAWATHFAPLDGVGAALVGRVRRLGAGRWEEGWPDLEELAALLGAARAGRLAGDVDAPFLRWRFVDAPMAYSPVSVRRGGRLVAFAALRTLQYGAFKATVIVEAGVAAGHLDAGATLAAAALDEGRRRGAELVLFLGTADSPDVAAALRLPLLRAPAAFVPQRTPVVLKPYAREGVTAPPVGAGLPLRLTLADCDMF